MRCHGAVITLSHLDPEDASQHLLGERSPERARGVTVTRWRVRTGLTVDRARMPRTMSHPGESMAA